MRQKKTGRQSRKGRLLPVFSCARRKAPPPICDRKFPQLPFERNARCNFPDFIALKENLRIFMCLLYFSAFLSSAGDTAGTVEHSQELKCSQAGLMAEQLSHRVPQKAVARSKKRPGKLRAGIQKCVIGPGQQPAIGFPVVSAEGRSIPIQHPRILPGNLASPQLCLFGIHERIRRLMGRVFQRLQEALHALKCHAIQRKLPRGEVTELAGRPGLPAVNVNPNLHRNTHPLPQTAQEPEA